MAKDKKKKKDKGPKLKDQAPQEVALEAEAPLEDSVESPEATEEPTLEPEAEISSESEDTPKAKSKREPKKIEIRETELEFVANFPIENIKPRELETRFRGKETEAVLAAMIQRFGWVQPIVLDADHYIVDGEYRYQLAKKWKLKTIPVVISDGVNREDGTTDLFHMLSGRIIEWDKWNYPATDTVLKSVDGGLSTEKVLGFETVSEAGELRALARTLGWFVQIIPKSLSGTTVTLETLAKLLKKQLAGKYQYDPAQLLYIEALREELEKTRQEMVERGETAGGVVQKLNQHRSEEKRKEDGGELIAQENGLDFTVDGEQETVVFNVDKEIEYVVAKVAAIEEAGRVQIKSAGDMAGRFKEMPDGKKVGLTQFKILATYFADMSLEEAGAFFNETPPAEFNAFVDKVIAEDRTLSPDRSKNFPMTEAELKAEQYRLRGEDIRKDTEKKKGGASKKDGLQGLTTEALKDLLRANELKLSGNKSDLIARLEEAGIGVDGSSATAVAAEEASEETDMEANANVASNGAEFTESDVEDWGEEAEEGFPDAEFGEVNLGSPAVLDESFDSERVDSKSKKDKKKKSKDKDKKKKSKKSKD